MKLNALELISLILVIVGGLNWGLVGFFQYNLVEAIFGQNMVSGVIYMLVGLAAIYMAVISTKIEKR